MKKVFAIVAVAASMLLATSCCNCKCKCNEEGATCEQKCDKGEKGEGHHRHGHGDADHRHEGNHPGGPRHHEGAPGEFGHRRHQMNPEMAEKIGKWMNFDSLSVDEQKALIAERKAAIDSIEAARKAKRAELDEKWANFDKLSIEEQKQLLDQKNHMPFHRKGMKHGHHGGPRGERN